MAMRAILDLEANMSSKQKKQHFNVFVIEINMKFNILFTDVARLAHTIYYIFLQNNDDYIITLDFWIFISFVSGYSLFSSKVSYSIGFLLNGDGYRQY